MLHLVVTMMVKEGRMAEFLELCRWLRPQVLDEPGCLAYDYTRDAVSPFDPEKPLDPNRVTLLERWESANALRAHMQAAHMKEAGAKMKDLRASSEVRILEPVF
jgi:quinol monooxygenase YgiN